MKGFSAQIKLGTLRANSIGGRNTPQSTVCKNCKGHKGGIEGYIPDATPFPPITYGVGELDMTVDWPFPQIFRHDSGIYIGTRDGLYLVELTGGVWTATSLTAAWTHDIYWPWTLVDVPLFPMFVSGDLLVYYDYTAGAWAVWSKVYSSDAGIDEGDIWSSDWYPPVSGCFFKGQIIMSGSATATSSPSHTRRVMWSEIGAARFLGSTASVNKNTSGEWYFPADDREVALRVLPLNDVCIAYGTFSIVKMTPHAKPAPTFGIKEIIPIGINNPLAVGGSLHKHLAVDRTGCLWMLAATEGSVEVKSLGYEEFLYPLVQSANITDKYNLVVVTYNADMDEFYISNGRTGFIYNDNGLTETCRHFTSFITYKDAQLV